MPPLAAGAPPQIVRAGPAGRPDNGRPRAEVKSAAGELHRVALRLEPRDDLRAMVALDLDDTVLRGAARAAPALEVARDVGEVARRDAPDDRDRLAATA